MPGRLLSVYAVNETTGDYRQTACDEPISGQNLAGGAGIHLSPNSKRYSNDLDYFQDTETRVAEAFADNRELLNEKGFEVSIEMNQPGYIRAVVSQDDNSTKMEWAHDSAWRFMPTFKSESVGYQLHPIDLAVNKILALAGRDEPRDYLDIHYLHEQTLSLGALIWAACGKDPGFSPGSLLELLKRRGKYRPEDFKRLHLNEEIDLHALKSKWLEMLGEAEVLIDERPMDEVGCLYYSTANNSFVTPKSTPLDAQGLQIHFGRPGGVLPKLKE